jgi:hypothetical protein
MNDPSKNTNPRESPSGSLSIYDISASIVMHPTKLFGNFIPSLFSDLSGF